MARYYPLLLFCPAGAMFMGSASDLMMVFVALELLSIPLYILAGFRRPEPRSEESAMKYFLLGAFATGFWSSGSRWSTAQPERPTCRQIFQRYPGLRNHRFCC